MRGVGKTYSAGVQDEKAHEKAQEKLTALTSQEKPETGSSSPHCFGVTGWASLSPLLL